MSELELFYHCLILIQDGRTIYLLLQELDEYKSFYKNNMESVGYSGIYIQRTGSKRDGCGILYKQSRQVTSNLFLLKFLFIWWSLFRCNLLYTLEKMKFHIYCPKTMSFCWSSRNVLLINLIKKMKKVFTRSFIVVLCRVINELVQTICHIYLS